MSEQLEAVEARSSTSAEDQAKMDTRLFLAEALRRFKMSAEHESSNRDAMLDDFRFSHPAGEQWPPDIRSSREADGRPCLTMDHLNQSVKQVTNELREQRPAVQINPVGDGADRDTADVFQGIIRHIEVYSDAEVHYDIAGDHMVRGGLGHLRVRSEYASDDSFDQEIRIEAITNPFAVYDYPNCVKPDHSDAEWKFIVDDLDREEFRRLYPNAKANGITDFGSIGDSASAWGSKEAIRVAEYFHIEYEDRTLVKLTSGEVKDKKDLLEGDEVEDERDAPIRTVRWSKITAVDVLAEQDLPGTYIPIGHMIGDDLNIDGKVYLAGLVRNAKEPQRMYNYQVSAATEMVALAPRAPFIGAKGQFKSSETQWKSLNTRNFAYLEYDPVAVGGSPVGPPQRNVAEPPIQATVLLLKQAGDDLKASMGIYDASLGQPGPEQSGKAILARQKQGDKATLNFSDNQRRTIRQLGRVLLEWIPAKYTAEKIQRIIEPDGTVRHAGIVNSQSMQKEDGTAFSPEEALQLVQALDPKVQRVFDIGVGTYDVVAAAGPSYQAKRQESVASIMALVQAYPALMQVAGDLLVGNMDWPYAQEISKRLKKMLPPQLLDDPNATPEAKIAMLQSQLSTIGQQHELLAKALTEANDMIKMKTIETSSKERIALFQAQAGLLEADLKAHAEGAQEMLKSQLGAIQSRLDLLHENMTMQQENELAKDLASHEASLQPPPGAEGQGAE